MSFQTADLWLLRIGLLFGFGLLFCFLIKKIQEQWLIAVRETSKRYLQMCEIDHSFVFDEHLKKVYTFPIQLKTKYQFDAFQYELQFMKLIEQNAAFFDDLMKRVPDHAIKVRQYREAVRQLPPYTSADEIRRMHVPVGFYQREEERLLRSISSNPVEYPAFMLCPSYTSPQGRSHYHNERVFTYHEMLHFRQSSIYLREWENEYRESVQYQRKAMTPSLRYDIMKRDGFRCCLCGRSANDGVRLHIDHIVPVSKGGKTVRENLRTLCQDCNLGKRDKYDPEGCN